MGEEAAFCQGESRRTRGPRGPRRRAGALLLAGLGALVLGACAGEEPRPNVVLVVVDTLRADHMSLHGYRRPTTPEIAAWAGGGTTFTRAWSASSWTAPSMAMLMTGVARIDNSGEIREGQPSLAEILARHGYATSAVVSNPILNERVGFDRGFGSFDLFPHDPRSGMANGWSAEEMVDRGLALLEGGDERPFFLYLHLFDPHYPYRPEVAGEVFGPELDPARRAAYREALPEDRRDRLTDAAYRGIEREVALYDAEVLQVDRALGRLFDELDQRGLAANTLVVLTSDHGEGLWQRAPYPGEAPKTAVHFPDLYYSHGVQLYDEQVHVPLVLRGPGVPAGRVVEGPRSTLDVLPTILARVGVPAPGPLDGFDLLGTDEDAWAEVYSVCSRATTVTLDGRWRLHVPREYRVEKYGARPELYDLEADPLELDPLDDPARIEDLAGRVERWRAAAERAAAAVDPAQQELMESMGYTGETDR